MIRHILLATNGTTDSARAEDLALHLAETNRATLTVLYVGDERLCHYGEVDQLMNATTKAQFVSYIQSETDAECRRTLEAFSRKAVKHGIAYETRIRVGEPGGEIVAEARECASSLVIIGGCSRSPRRFLGGSAGIGTRILKNSPCPVLVASRQ